MDTPELPAFNFQLLKVSDVESKLKNIDVKKATGYDKIPGKLLSKAYRELSVPMTNVLNTCISRSEFPAVLKCAELNPIYCGGDGKTRTLFLMLVRPLAAGRPT